MKTIVRGTKARSAVAVTASTAVVACGICCALPFAIPIAALGSVGGLFAWMGNVSAWLPLLSAVAVIGAWGWLGYQRLSSGRRPSRSTLIVLGVATVVAVTAWSWTLFTLGQSKASVEILLSLAEFWR